MLSLDTEVKSLRYSLIFSGKSNNVTKYIYSSTALKYKFEDNLTQVFLLLHYILVANIDDLVTSYFTDCLLRHLKNS